MCLVVEFVHAIDVHEVLPRLFFQFPVRLDPIKKLGPLTRVFGTSTMICFNGFISCRFLRSTLAFPSPDK